MSDPRPMNEDEKREYQQALARGEVRPSGFILDRYPHLVERFENDRDALAELLSLIRDEIAAASRRR